MDEWMGCFYCLGLHEGLARPAIEYVKKEVMQTDLQNFGHWSSRELSTQFVNWSQWAFTFVYNTFVVTRGVARRAGSSAAAETC